ncbi:MAG: hypothetical protein E7406_03905 [Ruminococcaceae bacterium]|nr:hypothetical protein [Oscillospiraceae bacterium]
METKLIVKYRRPNDKWICPDCDAESDVGCNRCSVCGCEKNPTVNILKAWSPELERVNTTASVKKVTPASGHTMSGGYSASGHTSSDPSGETNNVVWVVVATLFILIFILIIAQS